MEFPKSYAQYKTDYRENENERRVHTYLKRFFNNIFISDSSGEDHFLFGKNLDIGDDVWQFSPTVQISSSTSDDGSYLVFARHGLSGSNPTFTPSGTTTGYIASAGYTGSAWSVGASIEFQTVEA